MSDKRRRKSIVVSIRGSARLWRAGFIRLLHASVNRVTAGESRRRQKKRHCVYSAVMVVGSTGLVRSGATEYSCGVLRGVQANGGERVLLYQIGIAFARGGADKSAGLYDCYTQVSIASPRVRAGVSKKKRHCVYSAVMVVGSTGLEPVTPCL